MCTKRDICTIFLSGRPVIAAILLTCAATAFAQAPAPEASPVLPYAVGGATDPVTNLAKLADLQTKAKKYDDAIATWQSVFARVTDPHQKATVWNHIANNYQLKGDYAGSMRAMQQGLELWPDNPVFLTDMAMLDQAEGDDASARSYYEKAITINPDNPLALNNLAFLLADSGGDLDQALSYARAAESKLPGFVEVHDTIGWIAFQRNLTSEALNEFRIAIVGGPDNPIYHYHYALALYQQGDLFAAFDQCRAAISKNPGVNLEQKIRNLAANLTPQIEGVPKAQTGSTPGTQPRTAPK